MNGSTVIRTIAKIRILPRGFLYVPTNKNNKQHRTSTSDAIQRNYSTDLDNNCSPAVQSTRTFIRPSTIRQVDFK